MSVIQVSPAIQNKLLKRRCFIATAFHFSLEYVISNDQVDQEALKLNQVYRLVLTLKLSVAGNINVTKKRAEALVVASKWVDLEVNGEKTKHVLMSLNSTQIQCQISKRYKEGASKHNTLLRCNVSQDRQHVSALYYKAIIRSDK